MLRRYNVDICIQDTGSDMYEKMDDGIILCKMINLAAVDTIDERVINKGQKLSIFKVLQKFIFDDFQIRIFFAATREPDPGHQLGQGHRLRGDRHRQPHPEL